MIQARKAFRGPARTVFHRPEQRLRVRVIVTDPRATVGAHHTEFLQLGPQHHAFHRTAIVRVQNQLAPHAFFSSHAAL